jgi:bacteriorhodopsin
LSLLVFEEPCTHVYACLTSSSSSSIYINIGNLEALVCWPFLAKENTTTHQSCFVKLALSNTFEILAFSDMLFCKRMFSGLVAYWTDGDRRTER